MAKQSSDYLRKNVTFNKDDPEEMKLWEWLQQLRHGDFAAMTKQFWLEKMKEENK